MKYFNMWSHETKTVKPFGEPITFKNDVLKMIVMDDRFIVLLDSYGEPPESQGREVKAYTPDGRSLWEIMPAQIEGSELGPDPFVGLGIHKDGESVYAVTWHGFRYDLDTDTGEISNGVWTR